MILFIKFQTIMKLVDRLYIYVGYLFGIFNRETHKSLIQNESYQKSFEKTKTNGEYAKRNNINTCVS